MEHYLFLTGILVFTAKVPLTTRRSRSRNRPTNESCHGDWEPWRMKEEVLSSVSACLSCLEGKRSGTLHILCSNGAVRWFGWLRGC